ncbi:MAG TPA: ATP-binding protein [Gemmatimonadales bacterium]|jgi:PAS domain S-box-containing protein|nr:ATP-binding protein [Gemmatimonadales bacterium]
MNDSHARVAGRHPRDEEFRLFVGAVRDYAILMLDPEGRVTSWNEGAERIKGYTAHDILGQSFTRFYPEDAVASGWPQHELEVAAREGRFEDEGWRVRKDGSRFWANVVITALRDRKGDLLGFGKVTRDLTRRREAEEQARRLAVEEAAHAEAARRSDELARVNKQLEEQAVELEAQTEEVTAQAELLERTNEGLLAALEETQAARQAAEAAVRDLDQFAYVASHDLKAPLRGIANLAQWVQDDLGDQLPAESAEHLRLLQLRVHRMEALIEGILAYSRAGRVVRPAEAVDTGELVQEVLELMAPPAHVRIRVAPDMPTVPAERIPLQQVFMNLIGNAVKYAGAGRAEASVEVSWRDGANAIEFSVRDDGPGIAPEFHERIWTIFQTLAPRDKVEGAGVGLSLVKKIVESRGGNVSLDSAPGRGATFRFTWPGTHQEDTPE